MAKTIGLNMIVRNEANIIERCLNSVKDHIDYWTIIDTGSTDNTKELIISFFEKHKIDGQLFQREWINFGLNRTEALKLAKEKTDYILLIDADMQLVVHNSDWKNQINYDKCMVKQKSGISYYNTRLVNGKMDFYYVGVTHEYLACSENHTDGKLDFISMDDYADGGTRNEKYKRDIKLLLQGIKDEPNNSRYRYYLANSYKDSGQNEKAIKWYKLRIEMGGWDEEVWNSLLKMGRCYQSINDWPNALDSYLKAYNYRKSRMEPLYEIAKYYRENNMPVLGYHFSMIGLKIPYPINDVLFIEDSIYEYLMKYELSICTCYVNDFEKGRSLCDELIFSRNTPDYIRISCFDNLFFYIEKLENTVIEELIIDKTNPNHHLCNPSIVKTQKGVFVNIREVSYTFDIANNSYQYDKTIDTYNHLIELGTYKNGVLSQIFDAPIKTYGNYITGLEDLRLFEMDSVLWGIGTCRTTNPEGVNEMVAVSINEDYSIKKAIRLKGYGDNECQKNWVPIDYNGSIHFLYSSDPLILLKPNFETGQCEIVINKNSVNNLSNFRGSSQVINFQDGYLYVVHEVIHRNNRRYYYHRFVYMNNNLEVIKISQPFYFINRTIEYCAGLCQVDDELYITIGYEDSKAFLIKIKIETVNKLLYSYC